MNLAKSDKNKNKMTELLIKYYGIAVNMKVLIMNQKVDIIRWRKNIIVCYFEKIHLKQNKTEKLKILEWIKIHQTNANKNLLIEEVAKKCKPKKTLSE